MFMICFQSDATDEEQQEMLRGITAGTYAFQHLKLLKPSKNASKAFARRRLRYVP